MATLITGGTGFVGGHLKTLLQKKTQVFLSSRNPQNKDALQIDLNQPEQILRVLKEYSIDTIFHLAAQSSVSQSEKKPINTLTDNIGPTINVLSTALSLSKPPKIIFAGSAEVYKPGPGPFTEEDPLQPNNAYALSKLILDIITQSSRLLGHPPIVTFRLFNHTGPGQSERFVLGSLAKQIALIKKGFADPVIKVGNLKAKRDFTDVRDVCRAYQLVSEQSLSGEIYNICSGKAYVIEDLLEMLIEISEVKIQIKQDPERSRASDTPIMLGSYKKFSDKFGWEPTIPIQQTLKDMLDWQLNQVKIDP